MNTLCKTDKGQSEIQTRAHHLPPRVRQALILVDGRRDETDFGALLPGDSSYILDQLLTDGFIDVVDNAPDTELQALCVQPAKHAKSFETFRRDMVRALTDALGPSAEGMALRIEKTKSMADLGPAIGQAVQLMRSFQGEQAANAFAARFVV
jgi:plasmid stability protein